MSVFLDKRRGQRALKIRLAAGEGSDTRPTLALPPGLSEADARERDRVITEIAGELQRAGQPLEVRRRIVRELAAAEPREWSRALAYVKTKVLTGQRVAAGAVVTVASFAERWTSGKLAAEFPDHVKVKARPEQDERLFRLYILPEVGDLPIAAVRLEHVERVMQGLPSDLAPASRRHVAQALSRLLALAAYPARLIAASPVPRGFLPRVPRKTGVALRVGEEAALLRCRDIPAARRLAYGVLAREGLRRSELVALRWEDLDLEAGVIELGRHKTAAESGARAWALDPSTVRALVIWKKLREGRGPGPFVGLEVNALARQLRADLLRAGVARRELHEGGDARRKMRAHDLRATFVSLALAAGRSEAWITDRTGHTSSAMVRRYQRAARTAAEIGQGWLQPLDLLLWGEPAGLPPVCGPSAPSTGEGSKSIENIGGEGGIRTPGALAGSHDFQSAEGHGGPADIAKALGFLEGPYQAPEARRQAADRLRVCLEGCDWAARGLGMVQVRSRILGALGALDRARRNEGRGGR